MKILYLITQSEWGGAQKYVCDLACFFKNEHEVLIAAGAPEKSNAFPNELKKHNITFHSIYRLTRAISPWNDFCAIFEIVNLIKKEKPDIVHLNSSKISILGSFSYFIYSLLRKKSKTANCKLIYTAHGWVFTEPLPGWQKLFYFWSERLTAVFKDKIIVLSEKDYNIAINELKIPKKKIILIYNGLDEKKINFLPRQEARAIISQEHQNNNELWVGTIGNLYKTKGFEYLVGAIKILNDQNKLNFKLFVVGEGSERKCLENLISEYRLGQKIFLVGERKNAASLLKAFDIYVSSSVKEGFPYSILEAMAAELPIVATRVGGVPEMLINQESGVLIDAKNLGSLANSLSELILNLDIRQTLTLNAKKRVAEKFSLSVMTEKTKTIY